MPRARKPIEDNDAPLEGSIKEKRRARAVLQSERIDEIRRSLRAANDFKSAALPTFLRLVERLGGYWALEHASNKQERFLSPTPCLACRGHIFEVSGACVRCKAANDNEA